MHVDSLLGRVTQRTSAEGLFDALRYQVAGPEQAASAIHLARSLGGDLNRVHTVALVEVESIGEPGAAPGTDARRGELAQRGRIRNRLRQRLQDLYPGSLFSEHAGLLVCLLCLARDPKGIHLKDRLGSLARQTLAGEAFQLFIGLGNPCLQLADYPRGFAQAEEALLLGRRLHPEGEITSFDDLGLFRYLYRIARMDALGDRYQELVGRIAAYDRRKRAELLDTLEAYLENSGHLTRTSALLFVHRNTLIQRLERLQMDFDLDLEERPNWLALLFAIKVYKLRQELQRLDRPVGVHEESTVV
jgi:sugar diacid utilization regulator